MTEFSKFIEKRGWRLVHFGKKHVAEVKGTKQRAIEGLHSHGDKPFGFWFSVEGNDDGWRHWCEAETFGIDRLVCETEITIAAAARILHLKNAAEIDRFTREHEMPAPWHKDKPISYSSGRYIKWLDVAKHYDGIAVAPYVWARRLNGGANWYYGWDCASGCIWNTKAIASLTPKFITEAA